MGALSGLAATFRCVENGLEIIIQEHHKIQRELVESSAVWKTVWKQNSKTPQNPRECVESSTVWKTVWKSEFQSTTKSRGNWLKAPL